MSVINKKNNEKIMIFYIVMIFITTVYLFIEIPFSVNLLDILGSETSSEAIESAEIHGRFISGLAFAIALISAVVKKGVNYNWGWVKTISLSAILILMSIFAVYNGEKAFVDHVVDNVQDKTIVGSTRAMVLRHEVFEHPEMLRKEENGANTKDDPRWKALAGLFVLMGHANNKIADFVEDTDGSVSYVVSKNYMNCSDMKNVYDEEINKIKELYKSMDIMNERYIENIDKINKSIGPMWAEFKKVVKEKNRFGLKGYSYEVVMNPLRRMMRHRGYEFPSDWNPEDEHTFFAVVRSAEEKKARDAYVNEIKKLTGGYYFMIPKNFHEFISSALIQEKIRDEMGMKKDVYFHENMEIGEFCKKIYGEKKNEFSRRLVRVIEGGTETLYEDMRELGKTSTRMLVVPVLAMGLSILGMYVHIGKLVNYAFLSAGIFRVTFVRWGYIFISIFLLTLVGFEQSAGYGTTNFMAEIRGEMSKKYGAKLGNIIDAIVLIEGSMYNPGKYIETVGILKYSIIMIDHIMKK